MHLDKAIKLFKESVAFMPQSHPNHIANLTALANTVITHFWESQTSPDLYRAIQLYKETLLLTQPGSPQHNINLDNLANAL
jgi:hypothetical protein